MKRNNEKIPGFDDIVFRDRNKEYGAYQLRKRYGSRMSISILAGLLMGVSPVLIAFFSTDRTSHLPGDIFKSTDVIVTKLPEPPPDRPPEQPERPKEIINQARYMAPDIVDSAARVSELLPLSADDLLNRITNGDPQETIITPVDLEPVIPQDPPPVVFAQEMPEFPGGLGALLSYLKENIRYPGEALDNNIQGTVILQFVVGIKGEIKNIEVTRSVDPLLDSEAIRVVSSMPRWRPGKNNGLPVPVYFSLPVKFEIK